MNFQELQHLYFPITLKSIFPLHQILRSQWQILHNCIFVFSPMAYKGNLAICNLWNIML
jgi:hypothetical protein